MLNASWMLILLILPGAWTSYQLRQYGRFRWLAQTVIFLAAWQVLFPGLIFLLSIMGLLEKHLAPGDGSGTLGLMIYGTGAICLVTWIVFLVLCLCTWRWPDAPSYRG